MTTTVARSATAWQHGPSGKLLRRALSLIAFIAVVATAWLTLAPVAIGGPTSYVITDGTSMLPTFHGDGLVMTRKDSSYHVGEVVAYHNAQLHSVVMHRIVGMDGNHFIFKGDNNPHADFYHPVQSEIVGREWIYIPNGGKYFNLLREPLFFAIVMAALGAYAVARPGSPSRRSRRHHKGGPS